MGKSRKKIIQKRSRYFTDPERHAIIKEMLAKNWTKQYTWELYTGEVDERGHLLRWMRQLGYEDSIQSNQSPSTRSIRSFEVESTAMSKKDPLNQEQESFAILQMEKRIAELEKQLKDAEMKAIIYETMVDIAEKEFNITIKKKYNTKSSEK